MKAKSVAPMRGRRIPAMKGETMDTTKMTLPELEKALPKMSDDELRAAYAAERADKETERKGAIASLEAAAKERDLTLSTVHDGGEEKLPDGKIAQEIPGAQPASAHDTDEEREAHAEALRRAKDELGITAMEEQLKGLSTAEVPEGKDFDARGEVLKLHRMVAALAGHLNFPLPS